MMWILAIVCVVLTVAAQGWAERASNTGQVLTKVIMNVLAAMLAAAFVVLLVAGGR